MIHTKIVVFLLMFIAFVAQTTASTMMPCSHDMLNADMSMMHHAEKSAVNMEVNKNASTNNDCCQTQCQCPMSSCTSISCLVNSVFNSSVTNEQKITQLASLPMLQVTSSLFRPPIS